MKTRSASWLAGILLLALSGSALAHQSSRHDGYHADWSGSVMLYGGSYGAGAWAGTLSYGSPYMYAPGYIPWIAIPAGHRHTAQCYHGPRHGYDRAYPHGYVHGRQDNHHHGGKNGHRGRGRGYDD